MLAFLDSILSPSTQSVNDALQSHVNILNEHAAAMNHNMHLCMIGFAVSAGLLAALGISLWQMHKRVRTLEAAASLPQHKNV